MLTVARAVEQHFDPAKLNYMMLGNAVPHLHTHIVPRYLNDPDPGRPPLFMWRDPPDKMPRIPEAEYPSQVAALRRLLGYSAA